MKRLLSCCALFAFVIAGGAGWRAQSIFVSPDAPEEPGGTLALPWEALRFPGFVPEVALPDGDQLDALHRLDRGKAWLVSVETASTLGGLLAPEVGPGDLVELDLSAGTATRFFCASTLAPGPPVPPTSNLDAAYLVGGDAGGELVVSFDVPTRTSGGTIVEPADLARYRRVGASCSDWLFVGLAFDASVVGAGIPPEANVIGAAVAGGRLLLSFDVPVDLVPSLGPPTYLPGQIASFGGGPFDLAFDLNPLGWTVSTRIDALSCAGNPGRIDPVAAQITVDKAIAPGDVTVRWPAGCSAGGETYAVYEGTLASLQSGVYDHASVACTDAPPLLEETFTPAAVSAYYLVVPHNEKDEGSYGTTSTGLERPTAAGACVSSQLLTPCP